MAADPNYPDVENEADESNPADNEGKGNSDRPSKETTLIPATMADDDAEVGDVCKFKIVAKHEGELEIEWVPDSEDSADDGDKSPTEAMTGAPPPKMMSRGGY